jgi:hypothetical protein
MKNSSLLIGFSAIAVFAIVNVAAAATTISTNIQTDGILTVSGTATSTFTGYLNLSSGLNIGGATSTGALGLIENPSTSVWQSFQDASGNEFAAFTDSGGAPTWRTLTINFNGASGERGVNDNYLVLRFNNASRKLFFCETGAVAQIQTVHQLNITAGSNGSTAVPQISLTTSGLVGIGSSTPLANLQVANPTSNATTTLEFGSTGQNKGSCLKLYRTDGSAIYAYVAAGATTCTLSTTACANISGF